MYHARKHYTVLDRLTGRGMEFVSPIPTDLQVECGICYGLLLQPHLTECCGHHFCRDCFNKVSKQKKPCPLCSSPKFNTMFDKSLARLISGLKVYCTHKSKGCEWKGEVKALEDHQKKGEAVGECKYTPVTCANQCGSKIDRHLLKQHQDQFCPKKPNFNAVEASRRISELGEENKSLSQTVENLSRLNSINKHEISTLKLQLEACCADLNALKQALKEFAKGGKLKIPDSCLSTATPDTLLLPPPVPSQVTLSDPSTEISLRIVPYEFKFGNYERRSKSSEMWMSRPFYTHAGGYKMCVRVTAGGSGNGETTHLSVHLYLMKGEYDHMLKWPFRGSIIIRLINQIGDECHHEQTTKFNDKTPRHFSSRYY